MEALFEIVPKSPRVSAPLLLQHPRINEEYLARPGPSIEHKKGGLCPLFDKGGALERDCKLCTNGARCRPPAASSQRRDGSLGQLLIIGQVLTI